MPKTPSKPPAKLPKAAKKPTADLTTGPEHHTSAVHYHFHHYGAHPAPDTGHPSADQSMYKAASQPVPIEHIMKHLNKPQGQGQEPDADDY